MNTIKVYLRVVCVFLVCICGFAKESLADPVIVTTKELIEKSNLYDGRHVVLRGEVIGDIMPRGQFAWINIQDDFESVGVWLPLSETQVISYIGSYRFVGDSVEVEGIFQRADKEFGGEFCIRAMDFNVVEKGFPFPHELSDAKKKITWSMFLSTLCFLLLWGAVLIRHKRENKKDEMGF